MRLIEAIHHNQHCHLMTLLFRAVVTVDTALACPHMRPGSIPIEQIHVPETKMISVETVGGLFRRITCDVFE